MYTGMNLHMEVMFVRWNLGDGIKQKIVFVITNADFGARTITHLVACRVLVVQSSWTRAGREKKSDCHFGPTFLELSPRTKWAGRRAFGLNPGHGKTQNHELLFKTSDEERTEVTRRLYIYPFWQNWQRATLRLLLGYSINLIVSLGADCKSQQKTANFPFVVFITFDSQNNGRFSLFDLYKFWFEILIEELVWRLISFKI